MGCSMSKSELRIRQREKVSQPQQYLPVKSPTLFELYQGLEILDPIAWVVLLTEWWGMLMLLYIQRLREAKSELLSSYQDRRGYRCHFISGGFSSAHSYSIVLRKHS